jgi:hypothetical protein
MIINIFWITSYQLRETPLDGVLKSEQRTRPHQYKTEFCWVHIKSLNLIYVFIFTHYQFFSEKRKISFIKLSLRECVWEKMISTYRDEKEIKTLNCDNEEKLKRIKFQYIEKYSHNRHVDVRSSCVVLIKWIMQICQI